MTSVEQFVHRYLLERREIDIAELRESIQRYREVQKTIADLKRRLDALQAMRVQIETFDSLLKEEEDCRAMERLALLIEAGAALHANLRELRRKLAEQAQAAQELERLEAEITREQQALEAIRRQLAASEAAGQRVIVQGEIRELDWEHAAVTARLQRRYLDAARAMQLLEMRDRLGVINPGELVRALEAVRAASQDVAPPDWPRNPASMDALLEATSIAALALRTKAVGRRDDAIAWRARLTTAIAEDEERLNAAQAGRITLQAGTLRLMEALRREGMTPRTLCEVAEVIDERWRGALEALLRARPGGGHRGAGTCGARHRDSQARPWGLSQLQGRQHKEVAVAAGHGEGGHARRDAPEPGYARNGIRRLQDRQCAACGGPGSAPFGRPGGDGGWRVLRRAGDRDAPCGRAENRPCGGTADGGQPHAADRGEQDEPGGAPAERGVFRGCHPPA